MRATDARLSRITEYLGSIRTLKYFGWEPAMEGEINALRGIQQNRIWRRNMLAAVITVSGELLPMVCLLVTFAVLVLATDTPLEAPKAFTSQSIIGDPPISIYCHVKCAAYDIPRHSVSPAYGSVL
jgi:hypothetical protein